MHDTKPSPPPGERPTRTRYVVAAFLCGLMLVLYLDRICISVCLNRMQTDLAISEEQVGLILMAFTLAYGLFEVQTGAWGDRYGGRRVVTRIVLWWSAFTALTGATFNFASLFIVRFLFGAGEAGAMPNTARIITRWFPLAERGRVRGIVISCTLIGGAISPVLAAYLLGAIGWRWTFVVFGGIGVVWAAAFYWWYRDDPAEHPAVNPTERDMIHADGHHAGHAHGPIPWGIVMRNGQIWLLGGIITCAAFTT